MFEDYLRDAYEFYCLAEEVEPKSKKQDAKRYYRAAIFHASSAMEAFVNYIGDSFEKAEGLSPYERAFLNDKVLNFDAQKGKLIKQSRYYSLEDKLKFLIRKFLPDFDIGKSSDWGNFLKLKDMRDALVHPRQIDDETEIIEYRENLRQGMLGTISLIDTILYGMFKRHLRKQILDLIPD